MTAAPVMPRTGFKFMMAVREGPDKGAAFQLLPPRVTIGRNTDSNVVLRDPRMSRQAAVIDFSFERILITDVSSRSSLMVNGTAVNEASIKDGDVIRIGSTELLFVVEAIPLAPSTPAHDPAQVPATIPQPPGLSLAPTVPPSMPHSGPQGSPRPQARPRPRSAPRASDSGGRLRFYGIIAVVGVLLVWLLTSTPKKKVEEKGLRTVEEIEKEIKNSETQAGKIAEARTFKNEEEKTRYEEAQKHYLEGFRDYQKGQWLRAMRSFETARAIDPNHKLALRYYNLAQKERDEMIAMLMLEGRRYKEKSMYPRCSAALDKVLDAIPNKDDLKYKQAEALKKECDLLIDERFR